jgi:hypothetical protein
MPPSESEKRYSFDRPGNYRIRVEGFLDKKWSAILGGLRITTSTRGYQKQITVLEGLMRDQAELAGVLSTIYQRHLTLLSVEHLNGD